MMTTTAHGSSQEDMSAHGSPVSCDQSVLLLWLSGDVLDTSNPEADLPLSSYRLVSTGSFN